MAWDSFIEAQNATDVYGRVFDPNHTPITSDFLINSYTTGAQSAPRVLSTSAGSYFVIWLGNGQVNVQEFGSAGGELSGEFVLQWTVTGVPAFGFDFRLDGSGNFVAAWQSGFVFMGGYRVMAQRFAPNGSSLGDAFQVHPVMTRIPYLQQEEPAIAGAPAGGFVVAWSQRFRDLTPEFRSRGADPEAPAVLARCFDRLGRPIGPAFRVDPPEETLNGAPSVTVTPSGHIVFVWEHRDTPGGQSDVFARIFYEPGFAPSAADAGVPFWTGVLVAALGVLGLAALALRTRERHRRPSGSRSLAPFQFPTLTG